jgi:DNA-binding Lrp family transcriptional regulator
MNQTKIDAIDCQILAALQQNARVTNKTLAAQVGLSQSSCLARVRRLERDGIISGYHAELDLRRVNRPLQALIAIRYRQAQRRRVETFTEAMLSLPETLGLFHVTGADDFLLHVAVADTSTLRSFVLDSLLTRPEIEHVQTMLIYEHQTRKPNVSALTS